MDAITTARRLVALATGATTPPEEARTVAMALAALIAKHRLLDVAQASAPRGFDGGPAPAGTYSNVWTNFDEILRRSADELRQRVAREAADRLRRDRETAAANAKRPEAPPGWMWVRAVFGPIACVRCHHLINHGDSYLSHNANRGRSLHAECYAAHNGANT